jgi:phosphoglycerate dehydrogenase-like enzyme
MSRTAVAYTDMPWIIGQDGTSDPALATIERSILGDAFELRFAAAAGGAYLSPGPELFATVAGAGGIVINRLRITDELLDAAGPDLRVVARQGVGYDNLAPALLEARGIAGFNIPDYCVDEVATHALALLLAAERGVVAQHRSLARGTFDPYAGGIPRRLSERTVGIFGFGRIGQAISARLRTIYGRLIAVDPFVGADLMAAHGVVKVEFDELLAAADAITIHCPLNEATRSTFDGEALGRMRAGGYLVNTARGAVVDPRALRDALRDGRLAGAAIDVFDPEDPYDDELWAEVVQRPDVVVTSHRAFLSTESLTSQRRRTALALHEVLAGGRPPTSGQLVTRWPGVMPEALGRAHFHAG